MSDFDISADVELGSRASADARWEQAKRTIPEHDRQFEITQAIVTELRSMLGTAEQFSTTGSTTCEWDSGWDAGCSALGNVIRGRIAELTGGA
jgi:hypothetical protein